MRDNLKRNVVVTVKGKLRAHASSLPFATSNRQRLQEGFRLLQIFGVKAFGEPMVDL